MRKVSILVAVALVALTALAASAQATIHPLTVGWVCGNASGDPPGQTPSFIDPSVNHSDTSSFRAIQATGVLTFDANGNPVFNTSLPESKFSSFSVGPAGETGTPSNPGALNCANSNGGTP